MSARRRKGKSRRADSGQQDDQETLKEIHDTENNLREMLNPMESYIMTIQSVLVWEDPKYTAAMLVVVNILFWLATTMRIYHLLGLTGLTVVFTDMWTNKIWPEIRVPPPANEEEGWTPVHPKLLSVPEISKYLANHWVHTSKNIKWAWKLRQESRFRFFLLMMLCFGSLAVVGHYTSGMQLCYCSVMSIFLVPAVVYHQLPQKAYKAIEPHILKWEKSFNVKRKAKKSKKKSGEEGSREGQNSDTDSDAELQAFVPQPETSSACKVLSRAAKCEHESEEEGTHTSGLLTPDTLSQGPSREHSDIEEDLSFTRGLRNIPGIDDSTLDEDADEHEATSRLEVPDIDTSESEQDITMTGEGQGPVGDDIKFVDKHFKESSESDAEDENKLLAGLAMPGHEEVDSAMEAEQKTILGQLTQQMTSAMATEVMSHTMSSIMSSTMSGLTKLGETVRSATHGAEGQVHYAPEKSGNKVQIQTQRSHTSLAESTDSADILEEFEFLNQDDLDLSLDQETVDTVTDKNGPE